MQLLGAFINPIGGRVATALNDGVLGGGGARYIPIQGVLITDDESFLADASGNHISYAQLQDVVTGDFVDASGNYISDASGNHLQSFQIIH